jgi:DNA-binding MarR family transcriptional regulator
MIDRDVRALQRLYPQIYFACHVDHVRTASTERSLSSRDSGVLSHLDEKKPLTPAALARHLGVNGSTISALVDRLMGLGYVERTRNLRDRRQWELRLTPQGAQAMAETSVLDAQRVKQLLTRLSPVERRRAVNGIGILARAAVKGGGR